MTGLLLSLIPITVLAGLTRFVIAWAEARDVIRAAINETNETDETETRRPQ